MNYWLNELMLEMAERKFRGLKTEPVSDLETERE